MFDRHFKGTQTAVAVLAALLLPGVCSPQDAEQDRPEASSVQSLQQVPRPVVTISKETTVLTGPLRPDGYVDYVAALNEEASKGVTPENNAAVLFCRAFGPEGIPEQIREPFFQMLGIEPPPEKGKYVVSSNDYARRLDDERIGKGKKFNDAYDQAQKRPWTAKEFPDVAAWIEANQQPLRLVVEGAKRPRYYTPMLASSDDDDAGLVLMVLLPVLQETREAARLLKAKALLEIGEGKPEAAWQDLLACHRLGRLAGQDPTLIGSLVGYAIEGVAIDGDAWLVADGRLSADDVEKILADLGSLPPRPPIADKIGRAERYTFLDSVSAFAGGRADVAELFGGPAEDSAVGKLLKAASGVLIDWDTVLKIGNTWYDRLVAIAHEKKPSERQKSLELLEADLKALSQEAGDPKRLALSFFEGESPRQVLSKQMGRTFATLLLPAIGVVVQVEEKAKTMDRLDEVAFGLAAYRARQGKYPENLADVEGGRLPTDLFTGEPFRYKREGKGFLIYSLGLNRQDDGGRNARLDRTPGEENEEGSEWDDYRLRVPPEGD